MTTPTILDAARRIAAQLDQRGNPDLAGLPETLCRALKVQEEAGEMAQAVIGVLGQNPRKGVTHTWDDVVAEAVDTGLSALVLAETVQPGTLGLTLAGRLDHLARRAVESGAPEIVPDLDVPAPSDIDRRRAATLRWLADVGEQHGLPMPDQVIGHGWGALILHLDRDDADGVRRWAALLGAPVSGPRPVDSAGCRWTDVSVETPYRTDPTGLGWTSVRVYSVCDWQPATPAPVAQVAAPLAVVA